MKTMPKPLPATNEDPAVVAARTAKQEHEAALESLRGRGDFSALFRAREAKKLHEGLLEKLRELSDELTQRRIDYLRELQEVVDIGPDIPEGTSPADKAVLMQAFTNALDRARSMNAEQLQRALADAVRYGDDQSQRAIESAALEKGRLDLLAGHLAAVNPDRLAAIQALGDASRAVQRVRVEDGFAWQAFQPPKPPREVVALPQIEADAKIDPASGLRYV
jgi:hypothetical protein